MEFYKLVFDKHFDATFEQVVDVIEKYIDKLGVEKPELGLSISTKDENGKKVWQGKLSEVQEWGKPDVDYGYIKIIPAYVNSATPMRVSFYCSRPEFLGYWSGISQSFHNLLKLSDGSPGPIDEPWTLVPDKGYDRKLLELAYKGYTAQVIGRSISISPSRVYGRLWELRKEYGENIVPFKSAWRRRVKK